MKPGGPFDPRFFERHGLFWPIARAAAMFASEGDWPDVGTYARAFEGVAPVRFELAPPTPRRRRGPVDRGALYDARITDDACVPTRPRSWHDFLNALVWATFPRAKRALHARQLRAMKERIEPGARTLPPTRSREQDALALVDEGGVVVLGDAREREEVHVVFGHAVYEGLVLGWDPARACALPVRVEALPHDAEARIALAEQALTDWLDAGPHAPEAMPRVTPRAS